MAGWFAHSKVIVYIVIIYRTFEKHLRDLLILFYLNFTTNLKRLHTGKTHVYSAGTIAICVRNTS